MGAANLAGARCRPRLTPAVTPPSYSARDDVFSHRRQLGTPGSSPARYLSSRSGPARLTGAAYLCHSM